MGKSLMIFVLLFNGLKFGKNLLLCCNGYSHANFAILFSWISRKISKKIIYKRKKRAGDLLIVVLLLFLWV